MIKKQLPSVLILTSTYPRWQHDTTPEFVADFATHIAKFAHDVYVLAPHYKDAVVHEEQGNLHLKRYRYFFPSTGEDIFYNGGGISKIRKTPLYAVKLLFFMTSLFFNSLFYTLRHNVKIINAHWLIPQGLIGLLVAFLTGRKLAVTVHGSDVLSLNGKYMKRIKRFTLKHADSVYVNSSVTKEACLKLYEREYHLIPMGIDVAHFQSANPSAHLRETYHLNDFTILFVGRLTKEKGVMDLLKALRLLKSKHSNFKALVVGTGPLKEKMQSYCNDNELTNNVSLVGWVKQDELPAYYATANIFIGPSLYEAQGIVFLESLAAGLPVIGTNQGGMKDFVIDGENGFLITPNAPQELYEILLRLYENPSILQHMATQAPSSITHTCSWKTIARRYAASWDKYLHE